VTRLSPRAARGFTLIEVVVAFVMLSLILAVSFEIFSSGLKRAGDLDERSRALAVAQSQLAAAGTEDVFKEGETHGETEDRRYRWTTSIARSDESADPAHPAVNAYSLYRVDVKVEWRTGDGRDQSLSLATMGLGPKS
jgi:general secretion pathway protein I